MSNSGESQSTGSGDSHREFRWPENEDLMGLAEEAGRLGLFEWQVPAGRVRLSPKFLSLYGLSSFDGQYESWRACIFREDQIRVAQLIESAFDEGGRELNAEFRITRAIDGALRWVEARNVVFYDEMRRPLRVVGVNVDVTEQKRRCLNCGPLLKLWKNG